MTGLLFSLRSLCSLRQVIVLRSYLLVIMTTRVARHDNLAVCAITIVLMTIRLAPPERLVENAVSSLPINSCGI